MQRSTKKDNKEIAVECVDWHSAAIFNKKFKEIYGTPKRLSGETP